MADENIKQPSLDDLQEIILQYEEAVKKIELANFNIFKIISDYYYRENFHGDILYAFLDPKGGHGEGALFLNLFLDMIGLKENIRESYQTSHVNREVKIAGNRRIDFVIFNENQDHCVIIENKLYDANDQDNQLPAYVKAMTESHHNVDKVIYLPLSEDKVPDKTTWKEDVSGLIKTIPSNSLLENWIKCCINEAKNSNSIEILNQYSKLLLALKPERMRYDSVIRLRDFLCLVKRNHTSIHNFINTLSLKGREAELYKNMTKDLGLQLANKLISYFVGYLPIVKHPTYPNCCVIKLNNKREIYVFCAEDKEFNYKIRIINDGLLDHDGEWLVDSDKNEFESRLSSDNYIQYSLNEEVALIKMINSIAEAAEKNQP